MFEYVVLMWFCQGKAQWLRPVSDIIYHDFNRKICKDLTDVHWFWSVLNIFQIIHISHTYHYIHTQINNTILSVCVCVRRARLYTLSLFCPCLAMASYLIFPSASTCTARALDVFFFLPISSGNWATWISGKAPPSPKSYRNTGRTGKFRVQHFLLWKSQIHDIDTFRRGQQNGWSNFSCLTILHIMHLYLKRPIYLKWSRYPAFSVSIWRGFPAGRNQGSGIGFLGPKSLLCLQLVLRQLGRCR